MILFHLRFLFIRLPSTRRCGLAETVGLCFRVDSDRVTLGFVLGLVCVCLFVLFCSVVVVVVLFVVGRQQHCRYIVIDAMVYPKNWTLEDEFGTGKTSEGYYKSSSRHGMVENTLLVAEGIFAL